MMVNEARLRRQVVGREHVFAVVCPPGFETECLLELCELGIAIDPAINGESIRKNGGIVEFTGKLDDLYRICAGAGCISRVRVRLTEFHAGAREELFRKATAFAWELWLNNLPLVIESHVEYSRISHEGMAADTLYEAIERHAKERGAVPPPRAATQREEESADSDANRVPAIRIERQSLLLRIVDNRVSISLDASGEHQHRRGWRLYSGLAPVRENLAAAILGFAGWPRRHNLIIDGMCGSGTLAIEAAVSASGAWPNAKRSFAFETWPAHQESRWNWLLRQNRHPALERQVYANELQLAILEGARDNASRADAADIVWSNTDFFELDPKSFCAASIPASSHGIGANAGLLVLNPPYGKRIGESDLYPRLCAHIVERWKGWTVAVLAPEDTPPGPLTAGIRSKRVFRHGGLKIAVWLWQV